MYQLGVNTHLTKAEYLFTKSKFTRNETRGKKRTANSCSVLQEDILSH